MRSYRDMAKRLAELEKKVQFALKLTTVQIQIGSPLDPAPRIMSVSLADLYANIRAVGGNVTNIPTTDAPPPVAGTNDLTPPSTEVTV